jgi:hypothetical protein
MNRLHRQLPIWLALCAFCVFVVSPLFADEKEKEGKSGIVVDKEKRTITIDAKIAPRKLAYLDQIYPIEVIACWSNDHKPKGQKAHETVVTIDGVTPSDVHKALESLGLKPGTPVKDETSEPQGPEVNIFLEIPGSDGQPKKVPIERTLIDPKTNKPLPKIKWRFTGSIMTKPNPDKDETAYGADLTGTLITIFPVTNETVFQTHLSMKYEKLLKLETDKNLLPKEGEKVKLILEVPAPK